MNLKQIYVYEIYDSLNQMYYIGQRFSKTQNPEKDEYWGSSNLMWLGGWFLGRKFEPIMKRKDFKLFLSKKILYKDLTVSTADLLEIFEIEDYRQKYGRENVYNISDGGHGRGYLGEKVCKRISNTRKELFKDPEFRERQAKVREEWMSRPEVRKKMSESAIKRGGDWWNYDKTGVNNPMYGHLYTAETIEKQKLAAIKRNTGRKWWTNGVTDKFSIEAPSPEYKRGRCNYKR
jgi:hypothetical protein